MKFSFIWSISQTLLLIGQYSNALLRMNHIQSNYKTIDTTVSILASCFSENHKSIVLDASLNNFHRWHKSLNEKMSVNVIDSSQNDIFNNTLRYRHPYKINATFIKKYKPLPAMFFILAGSTESSLQRTIETLQISAWWNHEGFFVIVNENPDDYCFSADAFLLLAWKYDILCVIYLCFGIDNEAKLFTFNPYTPHRPDSWENAGVKAAHDGQAWTLFSYLHKINGSIECNNLYFDKTRSLENYKIRVLAVIGGNPKNKTYTMTTSEISRNICRTKSVIVNVWSHLSAIPNMTYVNHLGNIDENGHAVGNLKDILTGKYDIGHVATYVREYWKMGTYPITTTKFCFVTRHRGSDSKLSHILTIFTPRVWFIIFLSVIFSAVLLKCLVRHSFTWAFLHALRFLLGVSILWRPTLPHARMVFVCLACLLLTTNSVFVTRLSSLLTVSTARPNIDNLHQLLEVLTISNLTLYGEEEDFKVLRKPDFNGRYVGSDLSSCYERLKRGENAACIGTCMSIQKLTPLPGIIHFAKESFSRKFFTFTTRLNWPLQKRVSFLLLSLTSGGLVHKIRKMRCGIDDEKEKVYDNQQPKHDVDKLCLNVKRTQGLFIDTGALNLDQLSFNFCLLSIGMLCAFIAFLSELVVYRSHCRCISKTELFVKRRDFIS